jgi:hypothetical protein
LWGLDADGRAKILDDVVAAELAPLDDPDDTDDHRASAVCRIVATARSDGFRVCRRVGEPQPHPEHGH